MARVLLLATTTGYQTRAFGEAADRLGVDLVFATDRCKVLDDPWRDRAMPVRFHDEAGSLDAVLASAREQPIDGVLVVGDRPTSLAARVAEALGLPGHPPEAADVARNKRRTRERLRAAGLPAPWFVPVSIDADPHAVAGDSVLSLRRQAARALGEPRRHAGRRPRGLRVGVRAAPRAARVARRQGGAQRPAPGGARRGLHPRT